VQVGGTCGSDFGDSRKFPVHVNEFPVHVTTIPG
jgi:hypothetical protein